MSVLDSRVARFFVFDCCDGRGCMYALRTFSPVRYWTFVNADFGKALGSEDCIDSRFS